MLMKTIVGLENKASLSARGSTQLSDLANYREAVDSGNLEVVWQLLMQLMGTLPSARMSDMDLCDAVSPLHHAYQTDLSKACKSNVNHELSKGRLTACHLSRSFRHHRF